MSNRMIKGWKLYQSGKVSLLHADDELIQFMVEGEGNDYTVDWDLKEGVVRCGLCPDYEYRHGYANDEMGLNGSFICKHIWGTFWLMAEIRGVNQQSKIEIAEQETAVNFPLESLFAPINYPQGVV